MNEEINCTEPSPSVSVPWKNIVTKGKIRETLLKGKAQYS
jgi:hypothetical protein